MPKDPEWLTISLTLLRRGIKQCVVAKEIGISESRLSRFLHGYIELKPQEIEAIRVVIARTG